MDIIDQLTAVSPRFALVLALCVIGFWLKRSPVPNWVIPWVLVLLGGVVFPIIAEVKNDDYTASLIVYNVLIGILMGAASVGLHQAMRPMFPFLFPQGNTTIIKKADVKPEDK